MEGLNKQIRDIASQCEKVVKGSETLKKHLALLEDKKLDKAELAALHGLLEELERRMAQAAGAADDARVDLLSDKIVEMEQLIAKLDRRKVNRSEMSVR